jgi:hypothetical protein
VATYSFIDVQASITGPGGSFALGYNSGNAEEGITIEMVEDKNKMDIGADGSVMHSLHAGKGANITFHFLKTAPTNQLLSQLYTSQSLSSALWGKNVITVQNLATGDATSASLCAFKKFPNNTYAKDGNMMDWAFDAGQCDGLLGAGNQ